MAHTARKRSRTEQLKFARSQKEVKRPRVGVSLVEAAVPERDPSPVSRVDSYKDAGFLYDEHHKIFVCTTCPGSCIVKNPAQHFNSRHLKTCGEKINPALRLRPDLFAGKEVKDFAHPRNAMMTPLVGIPVGRGVRCQECGFCFLSTHGSGHCKCKSKFDKVSVQRVRQGSTVISYYVGIPPAPAPASKLTEDERQVIRHAVEAASAVGGVYEPSARQLGPFYNRMGWFLNGPEFQQYKSLVADGVLDRPLWMSANLVVWIKGELEKQWRFVDGLGRFAVQSVRWKPIQPSSRSQYINASVYVLFAAINLSSRSQGVNFSGQFQNCVRRFEESPSTESLFELFYSMFDDKLDSKMPGVIETILRLYCIKPGSFHLKEAHSIQPMASFVAKLCKLTTLVVSGLYHHSTRRSMALSAFADAISALGCPQSGLQVAALTGDEPVVGAETDDDFYSIASSESEFGRDMLEEFADIEESTAADDQSVELADASDASPLISEVRKRWHTCRTTSFETSDYQYAVNVVSKVFGAAKAAAVNKQPKIIKVPDTNLIIVNGKQFECRAFADMFVKLIVELMDIIRQLSHGVDTTVKFSNIVENYTLPYFEHSSAKHAARVIFEPVFRFFEVLMFLRFLRFLRFLVF